MGCTRAQLLDMVHNVLDANVSLWRLRGARLIFQHMGESNDVHIRLMVSRGWVGRNEHHAYA